MALPVPRGPLEKLDIPAFPLVNLWDGEDDADSELRETAARLELRDPIIGNLYRDGGEGLSDQIDAFVSVLSNARCRPSMTATRAWPCWRT